MEITSVITDSLIDFPGRIALVVFTPQCTFRCPACYGKKVIRGKNEYNAFDYLGKFTNGIVLLGGEPTLQPDIAEFCRRAKSLGLCVKLDTNGSNPGVIRNLTGRNLLDYVAMDVKSSPELYERVAGLNAIKIEDIEESMKIVSNLEDYEFRTTIAPIIRDNGIEFISPVEAGELAKWISETTGTNKHKYYIQKFMAMGEEDMLDERLCKKNLPAEMRETPEKLMHDIKKAVMPYLPNVRIR